MTDPLRQPTTPPQPGWVGLCKWLWDRRKFVWGTLIVCIIVGVGVNWLTSSTSIFTGTPLGAILLWIRNHLLLAGFIGLCLLFLTLFVGVVNYLADTPTRADVTSGQQRSRFALIRFLRKEYHRQMTESLGEVTKMALALQWRRDVTLSSVSLVSWRMDAPVDHSSSAPASIVQAYDDAGGGLLILGVPGVGKSTLLRELAFELLQRAEDDATQPVPVLVNLSSWALKKPPLTVWMVDRLWETYNIPRRLSQALIQQNQLLFLLDGLDEVEVSAQTQCIGAINVYLAEQEYLLPIVVCSRSQAYLEQEARLRLSLAVEVRPLTDSQVDSYLRGAGRPLAVVRATLRSNAALRELVTTPLMLSVVTHAYRGKMVKDLPQLGSAKQQKQQILERYVERILEQRTTKGHYTSKQIRHWFIWLAQQMQKRSQTEFFLEQMQPNWLANKRSRRVYRIIVVLVITLVSELFSGLAGVLNSQPFNPLQDWNWKAGLIGGLALGLAFGLFFGLLLAFGKWTTKGLGGMKEEIQPMKIAWPQYYIRVSLLIAVGAGLFLPLLAALSWGVPPLEITFRCGFGSMLFATGGLVTFGTTGKRLDEHDLFRPNQGIRRSAQSAVLLGLASVLSWGLGIGLIYGSLFPLSAGLFFGLMFGLAFGGGAVIQHFVLRWILKQDGSLPWRYARFLEEEAHERILLERVGGGYRFIHPLFQDYFASLGTGTPASIQLRPSSPQP